MISSISNNLSALKAFGTGLAVKSNNIANSESENFKKSRAIYSEGENGEVKTEIRKVDPDNELASVNTEENTSEEAQPSNVDLTEEIPGTITDQRGFEANLKVIKTREEMLGSVLDIIA
ncbi:MAG: flagellar basal body rod C-terminal domain-containing protein [Desulfobacteraceae bacterium]|jgi:flagellar basal-body rod protein FlgC